MGDWVLGIDLGTTFTAAAIAGPGRAAEIQFPILATDFTLDFEDLQGDANPLLVLAGLVVAMAPVALAVLFTRPKAPTQI